jgi:transketolase
MTSFGASAPAKDLYKHFGITPEKVADAALAKLGRI